MRPYVFLSAPLVLISPVLTTPTPVAEPAPVPQTGASARPVAGLMNGLKSGVLNIGSLESAVPAIFSSAAQVADSVTPIVGMFICS